MAMDSVKDTITKPKALRTEPELRLLVDFFRKKSPLMQNLDTSKYVYGRMNTMQTPAVTYYSHSKNIRPILIRQGVIFMMRNFYLTSDACYVIWTAKLRIWNVKSLTFLVHMLTINKYFIYSKDKGINGKSTCSKTIRITEV